MGEQVEQGLQRLYKHRDVEYGGAFKTYLEENGFDDDEAMREELGNASMEESQLHDVDMFKALCPWIKQNDPERDDKIWTILKKCYSDKEAYMKAEASIPSGEDEKDWVITEQDINSISIKLKEEAPSIYEGGFANDHVLKSMMAVERKIGRNYLQFLADMYMREHIYRQYPIGGKDNEDYNIQQWGKDNECMKELRNMEPLKLQFKKLGKAIRYTPGELAENAVKSYLKRVAPRLMLTPSSTIKGDLKTVAQYIASTAEFVSNLASKSEEASCPFQYDSVFAFDGLIDKLDDSDDPHDADDDDDDDEDDGSDDEYKGVDGSDVAAGTLDEIKGELDKLKLKHVTVNESMRVGYRPLMDAFQELQKQKKEYPRNHRFCSVVDLRDGSDQKAGVVLFETPDNVPTGSNTSLQYFDRAKAGIVPSTDPKQAVNSVCKGPQMTLSFQVDQEDDMRCYVFILGQCTRFLAEDIVMLLPRFFEDTEKNKAFLKDPETSAVIQRIKKSLNDTAFTKFLQLHKVEYIPKKLL